MLLIFRNFLFGIAFCLFVTTFLSCGQSPITKTVPKLNYDSTVVSLLQKVGDLTDELKLIEHDEFMTVYNNPLDYFEDASGFIANKDHLFQEKAIAIFSMRNLPIKKYIGFCAGCKELYDQKRLEQPLFEIATSANFGEPSPIIKNSDDDEVKKFLGLVYTDSAISEKYKAYLKELASQ